MEHQEHHSMNSSNNICNPLMGEDEEGRELHRDGPTACPCVSLLEKLFKRERRTGLIIMTCSLASSLALAMLFIVVHFALVRNPPAAQNIASLFPSREITMDLASLSKVIYLFHRSKLSGEELCQKFNDRNFTGFPMVDEFGQSNLPPNDSFCHWYHHDWSLGSQIMIVESPKAAYVGIVYCGTDDLQTSLTDVNIFRTRYGLTSNGTEVISGIDSSILVHAGFDHAVFDDGLFETVSKKVESILKPHYRIFTSGHSLGAADAILTAVGLIDTLDHKVTVINFGCPMTGNFAWRDYVHSNERLSVWRFVLGWDLVPRLPEGFYYHVGHTVQLADHEDNETMRAYYQHVGDTTLGYASVPMGWSATPFVWVPRALSSHRMTRYRLFLSNITDWMDDFVHIDDDDNNYPDPIDDDFYDEPPDDEYVSFPLRGPYIEKE